MKLEEIDALVARAAEAKKLTDEVAKLQAMLGDVNIGGHFEIGTFYADSPDCVGNYISTRNASGPAFRSRERAKNLVKMAILIEINERLEELEKL